MESTRTITAKSTIPLGTAGTGTVTALAADNSILQVSGGDIDDFEKWSNGYRNIWIYAAGEHKVAKMIGFQALNATTFLVYCDRVMPFVFNSAYTIIIGNLISWSAANQGAAAGELDGAVFEVARVVEKEVIHKPGNGLAIERDVVTVDGTGTSIVIEEIQ